MDDDDLIMLDETKSRQWNYVNRVEYELSLNNDYSKIVINPLLPKSYKEVIMVMGRACNNSRVALLIDDDEEYVAFMIVVDDECIPFLLDDLNDVKTPTTCIYKVFTDNELAHATSSEGLIQEFIRTTVIPDLNDNLESWKPFKRLD